MTTEYGPCNDWPVTWTCELDVSSVATTGQALAMATEILYNLTGQRFGTCESTLRPCRRSCADAPWGWLELFPGTSWLQPALIGGQWFNIVCGGCQGGDCACSQLSEVVLPGTVSSITEVKVDGVILDPSAYRLDNSRILVRVDGGEWPTCNDLSLDDDQDGTWSVTAEFGREVPEGGALAVGQLACEINRAINNQDCRLPANITELARQGVTIQLPDLTAALSTGRTGLYLVDMFIAAWNPNNLKQRSRTYSVDGPRVRRTDT